MLIILGLIILIAAVIVAVAGVTGNGASTHPLGHGFAVLGYHVTGSTGSLFLAGIVIGAAGVLGLSMVLSGARLSFRRGSSARQGLQQSRRETAAVTQDRDALIDQRDAARSPAPSTTENGAPLRGDDRTADGGLLAGLRRYAHRSAPPTPEATTPPDSAISQPAPGDLADTPASDAPGDSFVPAPAGASASAE